MKNSGKIFSLLIIIVFLVACSGGQQKSNSESDKTTAIPESKLQIVYFHNQKRCVTCNAVEENAKLLIEENYKIQIADGTMSFTSLNIEDETNQKIIEKYLVSYSTLLIINKFTGEEVVEDLTDMAFQYARNEPDKFKELLKTEIDKNLK